MEKKLYVGNLSFSVTENELTDLFSQYGEVVSAALITERETGRSKGFAFVEMGSTEDAEKAIREANGKEWNGRNLTVSEARPRPSGGGGGGSRGGFSRDRRGGGGGGRGGRW